MARSVTQTGRGRVPTARGGTASRAAASRGKQAPSKVVSGKGATSGKVVATKRTQAAPVPKPAARPMKQDLLAQIDKLERANATLRAKGREAARGLDERLAAIDARLEAIEALLTRQGGSEAAGAAKTPRRGRRMRAEAGGRDPGDAVPPGVAVAAAEDDAEDDEATAARAALESHLPRDED